MPDLQRRGKRGSADMGAAYPAPPRADRTVRRTIRWAVERRADVLGSDPRDPTPLRPPPSAARVLGVRTQRAEPQQLSGAQCCWCRCARLGNTRPSSDFQRHTALSALRRADDAHRGTRSTQASKLSLNDERRSAVQFRRPAPNLKARGPTRA